MTSPASKELINEVRRRCFRLLKKLPSAQSLSESELVHEFRIGLLCVTYDGSIQRGVRIKSAGWSMEVDILGEGEALYEVQHPTDYDREFDWYRHRELERVNHNTELLTQALEILRNHMVLDDIASV